MAADFSSLVALRTKQGELDALDAWDREEQIHLVQPLLELDPNSSPRSQLDRVEEIARKLHAHGRHLLIDASDVAHQDNFGGGPAGAFGELADRLGTPPTLFDDYLVPFEPVIRNEAHAGELSVYGNLCEELGLGGAIRVRPAEDIGEQLDHLLEQLPLNNSDLDIILDLRHVPEITGQLTEWVAAAVRVIDRAGPFRSMTLLSGSIPGSLSSSSIWEQPRVEEDLWNLLHAEGVTHLRLGDYGVVHPGSSRGFRSKHVNLKYSSSGRWVYSREPVDEVADDPEESARASALRAICANLTDSEHFSGPEFSWGDREISTASEDQGPKWGRTSRSVALATSHHLAYLAARTHAT